MGIKGIYGEIGPGERIALSKLAIEKYEKSGRPLRVAIDISIWQFQIQAGQGGSNPAIRTFYYRLLRLLSISVQPLFVFDGPNKPPFKRNKRSGHHGSSIPNMMCKQLLQLFGFPFHTAPGEAEAECAYLQREGIVDAVLSEDVDTLMFGCGVTLRNWSSEGTRGNKSPTHVSVYDEKTTKRKARLDREGMILIALMSGGDYITEGIPGCGIKLACEAARAGFGKSLCNILRADTAGLDIWRKNLAHEIQTNESKFFRVKHKTLTIPDNFPNKEVLGYYTHPVVSTAAKIERLREEITWDGEIDIPGLRLFVAEAFDWTHKIGARKFIRGLAPVLLVHQLRMRGDRRNSGYGDIILTAMNEMELVRAICGKRAHFSTDGIPELRVVYHPNDIVGLDLDAEEDEIEDYGRDGLAPINDEDQVEAYASDDAGPKSTSPSKRAASVYDPTEPDKLWIPETIAKVGVPLKVEDYEESLRNPREFLKAKAAAKKAATKGGMPKGAMDKFVKVRTALGDIDPKTSQSSSKILVASSQQALPPVYLAPNIENLTASQSNPTTRSSQAGSVARTSKETAKAVPRTSVRQKVKAKIVDKPTPNVNPWSLARSSPSSQNGPTITKPITKQDKSSDLSPFRRSRRYMPELSSSPPANVSAITYSRQHKQPPAPPDEPSLEGTYVRTPDRNVLTVDQEPFTPSNNEKDHGPSSRKTCITSSIYDTASPALPPLHDIRKARSTPEPLNRENEFFSACPAQPLSPALPSPQGFHPPSPKQAQREVISISSSPDIPRSLRINTPPRRRSSQKLIENKERAESTDLVAEKVVNTKKYIILRESLPGGWKEADEEQVSKRRAGGTAWRISQVEVLDLTEG